VRLERRGPWEVAYGPGMAADPPPDGLAAPVERSLPAQKEPAAGPTVADAVALATRAHDGQLDKVGDDYIGHPLRVMNKVRATAQAAGVDVTDAQLAAVLHDVVEDSGTTVGDLAALGYPPSVVAAVDALSKRPGEQVGDYLGRVARDDLAVVVKLADMADNSDPARLARLPDADADRLRTRYRGRLKLLDDLVAARRTEARRAPPGGSSSPEHRPT
jgi:HD domain